MTTPLAIVAPDAVTPAWLSRALQQRGIEARVHAFSAEVVGAGQLAETRRFHLDYGGPVPADAPSSIIGKFTCEDATAVATSRDLGLYRAEVMFYRELAPRARIRTPQVYVAELGEDNDRFVLLLEDLAPAAAGDHMQGCALADVYRALDELALLHGATWNDAVLAAQPWLYVPDAAEGFFTGAAMAQAWTLFSASFGAELAPEVYEVCAAYVRHFDSWNAPRLRNRCYAHGDYRVDNMLFDAGRICIVDWQTACYIGAGMDIAYFLGGALPRETRRQHEAALLNHYHARLHAAGVVDYSYAHFLEDYRHYTLAAASTGIVASSTVKRTPRGDRLFIKMVSDAAWHAIDNDALALLGRAA